MNKKYYFADECSGLYTCTDNIPGGSMSDEVHLIESNSDVIFDIYEDLEKRFPTYVKSTRLGEVSGREFKSYSFSYPLINNQTDFPIRKLKILITAGIHGYEQGSAWTLAHFFRLLCNNTDDAILGFMRRNIIFEVVPLVNIYGFEHNDRKNENGVDINRNFDADWKSIWTRDQGNYSGEHPLSEIEAQLLVKFLDMHKDAEYLIDYHNIASSLPIYFINCEEQAALCNSVFTALTAKWAREYPEIDEKRIMGGCKPEDGQGKFSYYVMKRGLNVFTLETPWCIDTVGKEQYDKTTIKMSIEVLVNTIAAIIKGYK